MSVKSAIFNSLFTTGQKINIAVSRSLIDFYSNILAMLSRCSLELSMGVLTIQWNCCYISYKCVIIKQVWSRDIWEFDDSMIERWTTLIGNYETILSQQHESQFSIEFYLKDKNVIYRDPLYILCVSLYGVISIYAHLFGWSDHPSTCRLIKWICGQDQYSPRQTCSDYL